MKEKSRLSIDCEVEERTGHCKEYWAFLSPTSRLVAMSYESEKKAKRDLANKIVDLAEERQAENDNHEEAIVITNSDVILPIRFNGCKWTYAVIRTTQQYSHCSCISTVRSFKAIIEEASKHAEQCFGGVKQICYI